MECFITNAQVFKNPLKNKMKKYIFILVAIIATSCATAQPGQWNTKDKKAIKLIEQALATRNELDARTGRPKYAEALTYVDKAIARDPSFSDAYILGGEFNVRLGRVPDAITLYQTVIQLPTFSTGTGYLYFELATLELSQGYYEDALAHSKKYQTFKNRPADLTEQNSWNIRICEFAIKAKKNPLPFEPQNLGAGVNTSDPEYFPTLTVDQKELLFTRRLSSSWQEDFFVSPDQDGYWGSGQPMPKNINTSNNEGAPTFAPDGKTLIFVGCIDQYGKYGSGRRGYGSCDLFITEKIGKNWTDPINLPGAVNSQNWETQPSLSSDGRTLYFIRGSIRGTGKTNQRNGNIFVSKLQDDGSWGEAVKLPPNINTTYSESSVLIHPDGKTLYFSSNGHVGMGGYDLFMTTLQDDGSWSNPKNLGYPINTQNDENSLLVYADGKLAVFASDRPGGMGSLDLYEFEMPESIRPTKTIYLTGTVFDIVSNKKLGAEFKLIDLETEKEVVRSTSDPIDGSFLVTLPINKHYGLFVKKEGYMPFSLNFDLQVPENSEEPYHIDVPLTPKGGSGPQVLANVLFDLDSDRLRKESFVELNDFAHFMKSNPSMKIDLQGHTDAQGDDEHNLDLSKRRAKSVFEYLVKQGVEAKRMTHEGYGETVPSKFVEDGIEVVRTEEWINTLPTDKEKRTAHQENRRTVYVVRP